MPDPFKYSDEDFKNKSTINAMTEKYSLSNYNTNDDNGYTPLCYMALNGLRPDLIVYLINTHNANASMQCDKGSTPLELACMSGNAEAVTALIGGNVVERDEDGNIIYTSSLKPDEFQPKKDAAGNPIPKRDSEDNIIYEKDICGTPYPLGYDEDPDSVVSVEPEIQYTEYKTERDPFDENKVVVKSVRRIPPLSTKSVIYKYEKDGSHAPMRDIDGKPLKQYNKDSLQTINKKDEVTFKPIRNKYEYVWDYESQPEYEVNYCEKTIQTIDSKTATVTSKEILAASSNKDTSILDALAEKFPLHKISYKTYDDDHNEKQCTEVNIKAWDPFLTYDGTFKMTEDDKWEPDFSKYINNYFNENCESPLICACRMQLNDTVDYILKNICLELDRHKNTLFHDDINIHTYIFKALTNSTRAINDVSESAISIARSYNDKSLAKLFIKYIPDELRNAFISKIDDDYWPGYKYIVNS